MDVESLMRLISSGENERVEFKKDVTKDIGEEIVAFSNSGGGFILIGVDDDGRLVGCDVDSCKERVSSFLSSIVPPIDIKFHSFNIHGKDILVIEVSSGRTISTIGGIAYIRTGTSKRPLSFSEILSLGAEYVLVPVDSMHTSINAGELSRVFWRWFLDRRRERGLRDVKGLKEKLGVVKTIGDKRVLTLAGLLFFHKDPQGIMPHTYVRIRWGDRWARIDGPIWMQVDRAIDMLIDILPRRVFIRGVRRVEAPIIPVEILREAIVNAVVHRNYGIFSEVFIDVSADGVRISNPGSFPPGTSPENPIPIPRNPILYELMFQVGYVERQGGGIEMMRELCSEYGIEMYYDISPYYTRLTFKAVYEGFLDELERDIISLLGEPRSSSELASMLGRSKPTIVRKLKSLERRGIVKSVGRGPKTKWVLK
jgi:ATP-dependent DNA helicase RecG